MSQQDGNDANAPLLQIEHETYLAERRLLIDAEHEQSRLFDRAIVTLSAAALGLSLGLFNKIIPEPSSDTLIWVHLGWSCFVASILATLSSFRISVKALEKQRDILDELHRQTESDQLAPNNCWAKATEVLNWVALIAFVLGAAAMTYFVVLNI